MAQDKSNLFNHPPASPIGETTAKFDDEFAAARRAEIESICTGPVRWEAELFSHNRQFGRIWRADFWELKRISQSYPTRVVCWTTDDGQLGTFIDTKWGGNAPLHI